MIKINLIGDRELSSMTGPYQVAIYISSLACLVLGFFIANAHLKFEIALIQQEDKLIRADLTELKKITKEVRDLEKKRETLKSKLEIIDTLKKRKIGPVRVLDDLNISVPEKSWLVEVRDKGGVLRIDGLALDNQTIADFVKKLEKSEYFVRVDLLEARQEEVRGVKMKKFVVSAKFSYGGSAIINDGGGNT